MNLENDCVYKDINLSLNADKVLGVKDGDIDEVLNKYKITQNTLKEMLTSIRNWYNKQPHLPKGQLHDRMIIGHLIARGFSVEQAKEKIDNAFAARHRMPDILCNRSPMSPVLKKYLEDGYWIVPPMKTSDNHRVLVFRIINPAELNIPDILKLSFMMGKYRLFNETSVGDHWVMDFTNVWTQHVLQFTPLLLSKVYYHMTSCYAPKIKGFHFINLPSFAYALLAVLKKLMKKKHNERLHLYEKFKDIYEVLPKSVFPTELGGTNPITCREIIDACRDTVQSEEWSNFYKHQDKYFFTDESKRCTSAIDTFGVEGSFRKLDLD